MAELSGDAALRAAFESGQDIHAATAARVYGLAPDAVTPEMRRKAKMVNFGIIYGISAFGLAQRLGIARTEAADIIRQYFEKYPGVQAYLQDTIRTCREHGYVKTLAGRRRYIRDIGSSNETIRSAAERMAINTPIQGTAADLIKLAMIRIHRALAEGGFQTRMILQVHDELVFDLARDEEDRVRRLVAEHMKTALPMSVPIGVEMGVGRNWMEAH
jgi:DNA polymerase I